MRWWLSLALVLIAAQGAPAFDLSETSVPRDQILPGGPAKDDIPAIVDPHPVSARQANFLSGEDQVLGVSLNGESRAYPIRLLNWHEIVNDRLGGRDIAVTYCTLCDSGIVFDATVRGERSIFGVSGLLYQSNLLLYDRETESLWSQMGMQAISGEFNGEALEIIPVTHTRWGTWKGMHPDTTVVGFRTGYHRDYFKDPYSDYFEKPYLVFPIHRQDERLDKKAVVAGILSEDGAKAYPLERLPHQNTIIDDWNGREIYLHYDQQRDLLKVVTATGELVPFVRTLWFAWSAFYPETELHP